MRLDDAWTAFQYLSAAEQRAFIDRLRAWHLRKRLSAIAARGGAYGPLSPPAMPEAVSAEALDAALANMDLEHLRW